MDSLQDIRNEMCLEMEKAGVAIERQHHEVATAGQAEIDIRFAPLKRMGDSMQYYKYILRNVAKRHNKTVTFMPKPIFARQRLGHAHPHFALERRQAAVCRERLRRPERDGALFHRRNFETRARADLHHESDHQQLQAPRSRIRSAGQSRLLRAQSFRRDSDSDLFAESESKANRIPHARRRRRIRISRSQRAACSPVSMESRTESIPGDPLDKNLYELPPEELAQVASVPDSLRGAIEALQADHSFLFRGDVFNADFIANWIDMKQKEYDALRLRPHPYEFAMYYDV